MKISFKEGRLAWGGGDKLGKSESVQSQAASPTDADFQKFKSDGFKNEDGSTYDPVKHVYTNAKVVGSSMDYVEAFKLRQARATPFNEITLVGELPEPVGGVDQAEGQAEVVAGSQQQKIEFKTGLELEALKLAMGLHFQDVTEVLKTILKDQQLKGDFKLDKNFDSDQFYEVARGEIKTKLLALFMDPVKDVQIRALIEYISPFVKSNITAQNVSDLLSSMYAVSAKQSLKKKFKDLKLAEFIKQDAQNRSYPMQYQLSFDKDNLVSEINSTDPAFKDEYDKYDKTSSVSKGVAEETKMAHDKRIVRARKFKTSFAGKFLGLLGIVEVAKGPEGETDTSRKLREDEAYAEVLKGDNNNIIAKLFIYFFGGGAMIDGGTAGVEEVIAGLPPQFVPLVNQLKTLGASSPLNLKKMAEQLPSEIKAEVAEVEKAFTREEFDAILKDSSKIPKDSFKLSQPYPTGENGLTVVLAEGSEMILPKGEFERPRINGGPGGSALEVKSFTGTLKILGNLPEGTLFKGKVKFEAPVES